MILLFGAIVVSSKARRGELWSDVPLVSLFSRIRNDFLSDLVSILYLLYKIARSFFIGYVSKILTRMRELFDMARQFAKAFYDSPQWKAARELYVMKAGGLCEDCLALGIYTPGKVVHHKIHITPENIHDANITLNPENFRLVCQDCHAKEHMEQPDREYDFDGEGNLIYRAADDPPGRR